MREVSTYYMNEGAFELPEILHDRTTHLVEIREGGHDLSLAVVRAPLPEGQSLRQVVEARVLDEQARLSGYKRLDERESSWAGVPALETTSRWRYEGRAIYQQQAHLVVGGTWIYFALSAPLEAKDAVDARFEHLRDSLRLRSTD